MQGKVTNHLEMRKIYSIWKGERQIQHTFTKKLRAAVYRYHFLLSMKEYIYIYIHTHTCICVCIIYDMQVEISMQIILKLDEI
jgi:hypothetical protein